MNRELARLKWRDSRRNLLRRASRRMTPRNGGNRVSLRTKSREFAMQMLFQWDMSQKEMAKLEVSFWKGAKAAAQTRTFANQLFEGAARNSPDLDAVISKHAANWRIERVVAIDEAVELAKKFSSEEAGGFVNGILDTYRKTLPAS